MYLQKDEEREKDPHNFPKPMAESNVPAKMQSSNEALEQAYELAEAENYRRKIIIGPIDAFPRDDLLATNRPFSLEDGHIVIYQYPSRLHDYTASSLAQTCVDEMNSSLSASYEAFNLQHSSAEFTGISDPFNCSILKGKQPDSVIFQEDLETSRSTEPIAVEVAFRHESFVKLLHEGCHILSQNSDTLCVFLVFMIENETQTDVEGIRLIVLERAYPLPSGTIDRSLLKCFKSFWPLKTPYTDISRTHLTRLPALLIYDRTVWRNEEIPKDESVKLNLLIINEWYGVSLFDRRFVSVSVRELVSRLFQRIDVLKKRGLYPSQSIQALGFPPSEEGTGQDSLVASSKEEPGK